MDVFALARLRLLALTAEYLSVCVPVWKDSAHVTLAAMPSMSRDAMVTAIVRRREGQW